MTAYRYYKVEFPGGPQGGGNYYGVTACHLRTIPGGRNEAIGGTATASTYYASSSDYAAANAFDSIFHKDNSSRAWVSDYESGTPWLKYDLGPGNAKEFVELMLRTRDVFTANTPSQFVVKGSDDDSTYTTLWSGTVPGSAAETSYVFTKPGVSYANSKTKWKLDVWGVGAKYMQIAQLIPRDPSGNDLFPTDLFVESDWDAWNRNKWVMFAYYSDSAYENTSWNLCWANADIPGWGNSDRRIELTFSGGVEIASMFMRSPASFDGAGGGTPAFGVWSSSTDGGATWRREWWFSRPSGWGAAQTGTFSEPAGSDATLTNPGGTRYWQVSFAGFPNGFSTDLAINEIDFRDSGSGPDVTPVGVHTIAGTGTTLNGPRAPYDRNSATVWNWDGGDVTYTMDFGPGNTPLFDRLRVTAGPTGSLSAPTITIRSSADGSSFTDLYTATGLSWSNDETKEFLITPPAVDVDGGALIIAGAGTFIAGGDLGDPDDVSGGALIIAGAGTFVGAGEMELPSDVDGGAVVIAGAGTLTIAWPCMPCPDWTELAAPAPTWWREYGCCACEEAA